jgi:hypothetical protein
MNTRTLEKAARRLSEKLQPRPRLIHCAGEVNTLLATLEQQILAEGGDLSAPVEWTPDQLELCSELDAWLEADCREIERCYNVRLVP